MKKYRWLVAFIMTASLVIPILVIGCQNDDNYLYKENTNESDIDNHSGSQIMKFLIGNYTDPYHSKVEKAGFEEKTVQIGSAKISYSEGPDNGPALLLLHAQMMDWYDYSRVLPELSKSFHIYDVDYHGHGFTSAPPECMNANTIGNDLGIFMESVIKEPAFVTGNSSGGLLTVWLAANKPEYVKAILLEDPPLFSSEYPRVKQTIAYRSFTTCHNYIEEEDDDFLIYWLDSSSEFIANHAGEHALPLLISSINAYREANPGAPVELPGIPVMFRMLIRGMSCFDPYFGNAFYDGTWNKGFDHSLALQQIVCPTLLLHANYEVREDGTLDGAMDQDDADLAMSLLSNGQYHRIDASHVVHLDKPEEFMEITKNFFLSISD